MTDGLKPILCMVTGIAYISVQYRYACREKNHLVGAKWNGAKWDNSPTWMGQSGTPETDPTQNYSIEIYPAIVY